MNIHKTLSISSLLSTDDETQRGPARTTSPNVISGANARFQSPPTTIPPNPSTNHALVPTIPFLMNTNPSNTLNPIRDLRISSITDRARKDLSPMSVSNLMNAPTIEDDIVNNEQSKIPGTVVDKGKDIPVVPDTTINKPKKAGKKELSINENNNKKDKAKKSEENEKASTKEKEKEKEKENEQNVPLIISIDIPLSTHNDVHMEHNFAKLVEEKYGQFETQAPFTKGLWNFDGDGDAEGDEDAEGEEEEEDDDDADLEGDTGPPSATQDDYEDEDDIVKALQIKFTPGMSDMEKESLVLKEIHRRKMVNNKRIGKYDIDDPFIDDEELEFEEETGANADGWFIWHGKLDVTKKRKTPVPEPRSDKPARSGKSSSAGGNSGSSSRSRNNNTNSNTAAASSATSNSGPVEKRKKVMDSSVVDSPPAKRSKKPLIPIGSGATSIANNAKNTKVAIGTNSTLTDTAASTVAPAKEETGSVAELRKDSNKIIIGSFGFGT